MVGETHKQSDNLRSIENNIIEVKDNAVRAEGEIIEAEQMTRSTSRKVCWLTIIIVLVVGVILAIVLSIVLK